MSNWGSLAVWLYWSTQPTSNSFSWYDSRVELFRESALLKSVVAFKRALVRNDQNNVKNYILYLNLLRGGLRRGISLHLGSRKTLYLWLLGSKVGKSFTF